MKRKIDFEKTKENILAIAAHQHGIDEENLNRAVKEKKDLEIIQIAAKVGAVVVYKTNPYPGDVPIHFG